VPFQFSLSGRLCAAFAVGIFFSGLLGCATPSKEVKTLQDKSLLLEKEVQEVKRLLTAEQEKINVSLNVVGTFRDRLSDLESKTNDLESKVSFSQKPPEEKAPSEISVPLSLESPPAPPQGATAVPAQRPSGGSSDVSSLYRQGHHDMDAGSYSKALTSFQTLIDRSPSDPLADNAQYWIGEIFYTQRDFKTARKEFQKVIDLYPDGNKAPDAHLKAALSLIEMGDHEKARGELERTMTLYPKEEAAEKARVILQKLVHDK
jgi:tol-pal system protein YbgF